MVVNPLFKTIAILAFSAFLLLVSAQIFMSWSIETPTELQSRVIEGFGDGWRIILGALIGLFSGKTLDSFAKYVHHSQ